MITKIFHPKPLVVCLLSIKERFPPSGSCYPIADMSYVSYCFTINNPTDLEVAQLSIDPVDARCLVFQLEVGENGTQHYQGYIEWNSRKSIRQCKTVPGFERAHFERRRGTKEQAIAYCQKEPRLAGPFLFGDLSTRPGTRSDLKTFKDDVDSGLTRDELWDLHPGVFARYSAYVRESLERRRVRELPTSVYSPREGWQTDLSALVKEPPHPRQISWYYCAAGNSGKSYFASNTNDTYVITGGKNGDIYYAYAYQPIVIFDWPRDAEERFPYAVLESFKNGYFLSTKYEPIAKKFKTPHVIVFANFKPDCSKLSLDRWNEIEI
jgi:hypothetical protein